MLNQRLDAARQVNNQLKMTERAIDAACVEAAKLTACMPQVRLDANIAAEIGQTAFERTVAVVSALSVARREIVAAHQELATVKDQIGLRTVAVGGAEYKGPQGAGELTVVANVA